MRFGTQGQRAGRQPVWVGWGAQALCPAPQGCSWIPPEQGPFLPLWETCPSKYGSPRGPRGEGFPLGWRPGVVRGLHTVLGSLCSGRAPHAVALSLERATCRTDPESAGARVHRCPVPSLPGLGQSTFDPVLQQEAGLSGCCDPWAQAGVPSAAGCPQSHVAAVASVCQRLLQHLGSHAVRGGLEPLPGRLPPAPGPDWAWGPCWLPALPAGGQAESAVLERRGHEPGPVGGEDLGQGQRTPGLLVQGPPEASLGAQGRGGEGEVLGLELELQAAGGQGVVCVARGLRGGQGSPENTGGLPRAESPHGREISPRRSLGAGRGDPS